jgi:hypothetical protein
MGLTVILSPEPCEGTEESHGFLAESGGSETGFFRNTSLLPTDSVKNPVSWIYAWAQKPGFSEILRCHRWIREKTRFLGFTHGAQKPGFSEILRCYQQIREKTRFLGFTHGAQKPGFSEILRCYR